MISILCRSNSSRKSDGFRKSAKQRKKNSAPALRNCSRVSARRAPHDANTASRTARRLQQLSRQRSSVLALSRPVAPTASRQIAIQETEHVRMSDRAHAFLLLKLLDADAKFLHFSPVNFWTKMVLGVIAVVEKQPVVDFSVAAHAPRNRLVGVRSVVPVVAIQVTKTMAKVPERQEIQHESPVNEVSRIRRYDDRHHQKRRGECRQFNIAPELIAVLPFPQILADRADVVAEETQKNIAPRIFGLAVMAVPVDR